MGLFLPNLKIFPMIEHKKARIAGFFIFEIRKSTVLDII